MLSLSENIKLAFRNIRANLMRAILTMLIIGIGITALVGILTALDCLLYSLSDSFNTLGANSFSIERKWEETRSNRGGRRAKPSEPISYDQAMSFKERFNFPAKVTVSVPGTNSATVKTDALKTNPNVQVAGIDENYFVVKGMETSFGRYFSETEIEFGSNKAIVGQNIVDLLFDKKAERAINKTISVGNLHYKIIGVLKSQGSSMNQNADKVVYIPLGNAKRLYDNPQQDYSIIVGLSNTTDMDNASATATGLFRQVRGLKLNQAEDFEIFKSDGLIDIIKENTATIRWAAIVIELITLLGAAIGLMNIMLVSVTERTREVGISKALGATRKTIMNQFLTEAIVICQLGGFFGIILGILAGNIVSLIIGGQFIIPWLWMGFGVLSCLIVGLASGLYPAAKAAKLDPIESLRYE